MHHIVKKETQGETITEVKFDMEFYFKSALDEYLKVADMKLTKAASPFVPRIPSEEMDKLMTQEGKLAKHAASLIMKLMYGVRMAWPHLSVVVNRLSSQITRWTADSDRRLHRVYCYINDALDMKLTGSLSTADVHGARLIAWPDADHNGDVMDTKSTRGFFLELAGKDGRAFPLSWGSRKQGSSAQHSAEAEIVSMVTCV